ncbi:plasmid related protein [Pseudoxanthomonas kaohsiungensis]|uniref:Plasmid related protein n=1 Tax=Pseudoxanthomonas kaohsiungensis TaxID=283923 RepID=A0ABW3LYW3_9GAMM|nr:plasmid related protein [Pseudoxanthomonas kaohsiungensis]
MVTTNLVNQLGGEPDAFQTLLPLVRRHARGDWGDVLPEDREANDAALAAGRGRLMSIYRVPHAGALVEAWVITEADRSSTTALAPEDY